MALRTSLAGKLEEEMQWPNKKYPDYERVSCTDKNKITKDKFKLGSPVDCYIETYTKPRRKNGEEMRGSQAAFHLIVNDDRGKDVYNCFIKEISQDLFEVGSKVLCVIRKIKIEEGVVYLEQRVKKGNEFLICIRGKAKKPGQYYSPFLEYDVFVRKGKGSSRKLKKIAIGWHYKVRAETVIEKHDDSRRGIIQAVAIERITHGAYDKGKEKIIRNKNPK